MRTLLILAFYLVDELLSGLLPFSSGPFAIALIAICMSRAIVERGVLIGIVVASATAFGAGLAGAVLSGTPVSAFFVATVAVLACMWAVGTGLRGRNSVLITERGAFVGVLVSSGFLLLSVLGWDAMSLFQGEPTNRPSGLFHEPSHYALFVMPLWLIAFQCQRYRPWLYAALALAAGLCFSTTLAIFLICAFALKVYLCTTHANFSLYKLGSRLMFGVVLAILAYNLSSLIYVADMSMQAYVGSRLYVFIDPDDAAAHNLSSDVILQGIELAQLSFFQSFGFGVGLGNFGASEQVVDLSVYRSLINATLNGYDLNLRDGGVLASKVLGELGVFALMIPLALSRYFRRLKATVDSSQLNYHRAFAVALICLLFVRALPYFSAPVCLAVFSLAGVLNSRARMATRRRIIRPRHSIAEAL
ncbi:MAG: hypothetical protein ACXV8I_01175 [Methylobacter sp.]